MTVGRGTPLVEQIADGAEKFSSDNCVPEDAAWATTKWTDDLVNVSDVRQMQQYVVPISAGSYFQL